MFIEIFIKIHVVSFQSITKLSVKNLCLEDLSSFVLQQISTVVYLKAKERHSLAILVKEDVWVGTGYRKERIEKDILG